MGYGVLLFIIKGMCCGHYHLVQNVLGFTT